MTRRIIYEHPSHRWVRKWQPHDDDAVAGYWLATILGPIPVFLAGAGVGRLFDWLFIPGQWGQTIDQGSAVMGVSWWAVAITYHVWRNQRVLARTDSEGMVQVDKKFCSLPSELKAEASMTRNLAIEYMRDGNKKGMGQCLRVLNEMVEASQFRTEHRHTRDAKNPEIGRALGAAMKHREETLHLYRAEIESGSSDSEPEPEVEIVDGELMDPKTETSLEQRIRRAHDRTYWGD